MLCYYHPYLILYFWFFFFFNDTATTEIYTLSLHDALPIFEPESAVNSPCDKPARDNESSRVHDRDLERQTGVVDDGDRQRAPGRRLPAKAQQHRNQHQPCPVQECYRKRPKRHLSGAHACEPARMARIEKQHSREPDDRQAGGDADLASPIEQYR